MLLLLTDDGAQDAANTVCDGDADGDYDDDDDDDDDDDGDMRRSAEDGAGMHEEDTNSDGKR